MANVMQRDRAQGATAAQFLPSVNPFLGLLPAQYWDKVKDFFAYETDFLGMGPSATQTLPEQIQGDSDFLFVALNRVVTAVDNVTVKTFAPFTLQIADAGSGRNLGDQAIHLENIAGTAQLPGILPFPKIIRQASTLSLTLTNLDTVNSYNVRLTLLGFKIFPQSMTAQG